MVIWGLSLELEVTLEMNQHITLQQNYLNVPTDNLGQQICVVLHDKNAINGKYKAKIAYLFDYSIGSVSKPALILVLSCP